MPKQTATKKNTKSKFINDELNDFITSSEYLKVSPRGSNEKLPLKRHIRTDTDENADAKCAGDYNNGEEPGNDEDYSKMFNQFQSEIVKKKKKMDAFATNIFKDSQKKFIEVMDSQSENRKQGNERLLKSLSAVLTQLEADGAALKENEQRLQHLTAAHMKCVQQATLVHKQRVQALKEIHASYMKQCELMETNHREESNALSEEMANDVKKMQQKLINESRRNSYDSLRKKMMYAMQCEF